MIKTYQCTLATSAILLSMGMLRYFSLWEPLGKLTIMVFAMMKDLASFAIFFLICIFGFCVAFFSLFRDDASFATSGQTSMTLFSATLNNYDATFEVFSKKDPSYSLGIVLEVIYIMLSSVVLMNLVVAKMAATHQHIDQRSFQEWQFATARTVKQFLLFEEKNPLCMLPAPLNLLPSILFPLHMGYLNFVSGAKIHEIESKLAGAAGDTPRLISVAGSASDICVGVVFAFIAPFIELINYVYRMFQYKKRRRHADLKAKSRKLPLLKLEPLMFIFIFPFIYPFFVAKLLIEACSLLTMLTLEHTDQGVRRIVDFQHRNVYRRPEVSSSDADVLTIKILRGEKLRRCYDNSNVAVKVRLADMEHCTGSSIYRGSDPVFTNEIMQFPLEGLNYTSDAFGLEFEVVDRDIFTGFETVVGGYKMTAESTRAFIANGRLEERICLAGGDGYIVCVGKVDFPAFLVEKKVTAVAERTFSGAQEKVKIRKASYKESYASFRKRHSRISPADSESPQPVDECKSEIKPSVVEQDSADTQLNAGAEVSVAISPTIAAAEADPARTGAPRDYSQSEIGANSASNASLLQEGEVLARSVSSSPVLRAGMSPPPTAHFRSLAASRSSVNNGTLQTVEEEEAAERVANKAKPAGKVAAAEYYKAFKMPPIFTLADKERIFYHALRPKGLSANIFDVANSFSAGGASAVATPMRAVNVPQASLNVRNFPAGSGKDANAKIFNYLFSSSVDPQDNYKSLSSASTPVYATAHGAAVPSAGGPNGNLNAMSFIVPGNKSFFPGGLTGGAHYQLQRGNTNDDDFDAFALSNPNDIVL